VSRETRELGTNEQTKDAVRSSFLNLLAQPLECESLILRLLCCLQPSNGIPMISLDLALLSVIVGASGYYAPDVPPRTFVDGERIQLWVNSLTSTHTQLPRDYYRLPFCTPQGGPVLASENLGERLTGNKIQSSPYVIHVGKNAYCQRLCEKTLD
jgi:Endomembrane protein 70